MITKNSKEDKFIQVYSAQLQLLFYFIDGGDEMGVEVIKEN